MFLFAFFQADVPATLQRTLSNGAQIIVQRIPDSVSFSAQVLVRAGSCYETEETSGLHHLLEHMLFRGSKQFGPGELDKTAESAGCFLNATTHREFVNFACDGPSPSWKQGVAALLGLLQEPILDEAAIDLESQIIREEIALQDADPIGVMERRLWATACSASPWALRTSGSAKKISRKLLLDAFHKHYSASNLVVTFAGDAPPSEVLALISAELIRIPSGYRIHRPPFPKISNVRSMSDNLTGLGAPIPGINSLGEFAAAQIAVEALLGRRSKAAELGLQSAVFFIPSEAESLLVAVISGDIAKQTSLWNEPASLSATDISLARKTILARLSASLSVPNECALLWGIGALFGRNGWPRELENAISKSSDLAVTAAANRLREEWRGP